MSGPGPGSGVQLCGLTLEHPIINGSGTFDALAAARVFGPGVTDPFPFSAYVSKTITAEPRSGNPPPRLWETPGGMINSIGLPGRGLHGYLQQDLPALHSLLGGRVPLITNIMASDGEALAELAAAFEDREEVAALELNLSCPNVRTGLDLGSDPGELERAVARVRRASAKPLIVKLTPNTSDVPACAHAAQEAGADAVSLINTLRAMARHPDRPGAWLGAGTGGLSGPAIRPVALAQVAAVCARVSIPVVGMGGVASGRHAREMLDAGARAVAVGTESFRDPAAGLRIARELASLRHAGPGPREKPLQTEENTVNQPRVGSPSTSA